MSQIIRLKKGFDINLKGAAKKEILPASQPETFAVRPPNFIGAQRPKTLVEVGQNVKAGTPVFSAKNYPDVVFASPVSGEVVEIVRGDKRVLNEIRILADSEVDHLKFKQFSPSDLNNADGEEIKQEILKSGIWPNLIQRPYAVIADPNEKPKSTNFLK